MKEAINKLEDILSQGETFFVQSNDSELSLKPKPESWSKKEILGHLIDSSLYNIQRFTEIQYESKPFEIKRYNQDELIKANKYQNADYKNLVQLWLSLNYRIIQIILSLPKHSFDYKIIFEDGTTSDLRFLIQDYVNHLEHHINQITNNTAK